MLIKKYSFLLKITLYTLAGIVSFLLIAMAAIPYFFQDQIQSTVKKVINENIEGQVYFSEINLSFFTHFPSLTTSIHDVKLTGSAPYKDSTLLDVNEISLGINLLSLLQNKIVLDKFIVSEGRVNILVDSNGMANYNIYKSSGDSTNNETPESQSQMAFKLLKLQDIDLNYQDLSIPMHIKASNLDYEGKGDLTSSIFALETDAHIQSFSFAFDNEEYIKNKSLHAELITQINTNDLSFIFEKNDIKINKLPVRFKGAFAFLSNGYHLDFKLKSQESTLDELLSLVPDGYNQWLRDTKIKGTSEVFMNLIGDYIVEENKMPDLSLGIIINNGHLAYKNAPIPVSDWNAKVKVDLPKLNPDSLHIDLKQFEFKVANGFFKTIGNIKGLLPMTIHSAVQSSLDLGNLHQATQWPDFKFAGKLDLTGRIDGTFAMDTIRTGIRQKEDVYISSIPTFHIKNTLQNGYFKMASLPAAIEKINYTLEAIAKDNQIKNAQLALKGIDIQSMNNFIKGYADVKDFQKLHLDANLQADINLADIKNIYPIDSVDLAGNIFVNIISQGFIDLKNNKIPETSASVSMKNGYFKSWAYPIPLEQINVETYINSKSGSLQDLNIKILPISFKLAGEPFFLNADFKNFNDIKYAIRSKGKLNLEPIYKMFAVDGINMNGYVRTDIDLAGLQSDALKGNYSRLKNDGFIDIAHINIATELLPKTVEIKSGKLSFKKEKLHIDKFITQYGDNEITIKGFVNNIVNYLTMSTDILKGKFEINSKKINIDDFLAFNTSTTTSTSNSNLGVVLLPQNVDIDATGIVNQVYYDQILLKNVKSQLKLKSGTLSFTNTGFEIAGLKTNMDINYRPLNPRKAKFDFAVKADSFDIQRAYHEIPLFQQMVTSAKNAFGIVSLDYKLGGLLNDEMSPIISSIQGKGTLTLDQIKFHNFKLLNGISKQTGKESLLDSEVKKVRINTSIKNNVMTIERTKMKMAGFRPRFEGQVTLDGQMNLGFRLGLPPWGIFGVPMRITGTADNYKIKLGKYKEEDLDTDMDDEDRVLYEASLVQDTLKTTN